MNFFEEEKLFRVEIVRTCQLPINPLFSTSNGYLPSPDSLKNGERNTLLQIKVNNL